MLDRFVGIPYVQNGREYEGSDCWGVVYLYYRDVLGKLIPTYSAEMEARQFTNRDIGPLLTAERDLHWHSVEHPQAGDCVLMRAGRHNSHVGIYLGNGRMLHSEGPEPSVIERVDGMRWRNRISGYYRLNK